MSQPESRKPQQGDAYDRTESLPARKGFLHDHHPSQHRHPHQVAYPETEHDEHQCPTAAQAERTVAQTQMPGCSYPLAIVAYKETKRAAALLETTSLEWAELKAARHRESGGTNQPGMLVEPGPTVYQAVDLGISQQSNERERRPDEGIACQERRLYRSWMRLLSTGMHHHVDHRHT